MSPDPTLIEQMTAHCSRARSGWPCGRCASCQDLLADDEQARVNEDADAQAFAELAARGVM